MSSTLQRKQRYHSRHPDEIFRTALRKSIGELPILEVLDVRQNSSFACGAAAAMTVGRFFGVGPDTLDEWIQALGTTAENGTSPKAIVDYLTVLGLDVKARDRMTVRELAWSIKEERPVIVCCQDYSGARSCFLPSQVIEGAFIGGSKSWYSGKAVKIRTRHGAILTVTVNHPVSTMEGLVPAGRLKEGDNLLNHGGELQGNFPNHKQHAPSRVDKVFETLKAIFGSVLSENSANSRLDFHGDGEFIQAQIEVVGSYCKLGSDIVSYRPQCFGQRGLSNADLFQESALIRRGRAEFRRVASAASENGLMRSRCFDGALTRVDIAPGQSGRFAPSSEYDSSFHEDSLDCPASNSTRLGELREGFSCSVFRNERDNIGNSVSRAISLDEALSFCGTPDGSPQRSQSPGYGALGNSVLCGERSERLPAGVFLDEVVHTESFFYEGWVYDFESTTGHIIADGLQVANSKASFSYGHYLVCVGVIQEGAYLVFQDSSIENAEHIPGGDVPKEGEDRDENISAPGRILVRTEDWLRVWHDKDKSGKPFIRYGISVGPGQTGSTEQSQRSLPEGFATMEAFLEATGPVDVQRADEQEWITANGAHIPIGKGQSKEQAVKEHAAKNEDSDSSKASHPIDDSHLDTMKVNYTRITDASQRAEVKQAVTDYATGGTYTMTNGVLRGTEKSLGSYQQVVEKDIARLRTAFDKASHTLQQDVTVYRGVGKMPVDLKVGATFTDKGFVSTTASRDFAKEFVGGYGGKEKGGMLFEIHVPKGSHVLVPLGSSNRKREVVLRDSTKFKMVGRNGNALQLEVVQ